MAPITDITKFLKTNHRPGEPRTPGWHSKKDITKSPCLDGKPSFSENVAWKSMILKVVYMKVNKELFASAGSTEEIDQIFGLFFHSALRGTIAWDKPSTLNPAGAELGREFRVLLKDMSKAVDPEWAAVWDMKEAAT